MKKNTLYLQEAIDESLSVAYILLRGVLLRDSIMPRHLSPVLYNEIRRTACNYLLLVGPSYSFFY